jgi:hypothetical protein
MSAQNILRVSDNHLQYDNHFCDLLIANSVYVCWLGDDHTHESRESIRTLAPFAGEDRHLNRVQHAAYSRIAVGDRFVLHRKGTRDIYIGVVQGAATETVVADGVESESAVSWRNRVSHYSTRAHKRHIAYRMSRRSELFVCEAVFPVRWTHISAATDDQVAWCSTVRGTFVHRKTPFPLGA